MKLNSMNLMKIMLKNWIELSKWASILSFQVKGAEILEQEKNWIEWFKLLDDLKVRYSRLDIALDDFRDC